MYTLTHYLLEKNIPQSVNHVFFAGDLTRADDMPLLSFSHCAWYEMGSDALRSRLG